MGRGTTPLQAALMGRRPVGSDINPLSAMLLAPRLAPPSLEDVAARLAEIPPSRLPAGRAVAGRPARLLPRLGPRPPRRAAAHGSLSGSGRARSTRWTAGCAWVLPQPPHRPFARLLLGLYHAAQPGRRGGTASAASMPSAGRRRPLRDVDALILRKSRLAALDGRAAAASAGAARRGPGGECRLRARTARSIWSSPPRPSSPRWTTVPTTGCAAGSPGIDRDALPIAAHRTPDAWRAFVHASLRDIARTLRPGSFLAFEVGEVRGGKVLLEDHVVAAAGGLPLAVEGVMVNEQRFTKTANCWGVANNRKGTNTNRIVLMRKLKRS